MKDNQPESTSSRVDRRTLIRSATAATAMAAGAPLLAHAQSATPAGTAVPKAVIHDELPANWDKEVDVIVVGSGGAAFAAAVTARQAGADVLMLERAAKPGGTTQVSGSVYWIPNNSKMIEAGKTDPREDALKYMARLAEPQLYDPESSTLGLAQDDYDLLATFYDTGSVAVDDFEEWGALYSKVQPPFGDTEDPDISDPDYHADLPEDKAPHGRALIPDPDKGGSTALPEQMQKWTDEHEVPILTEHRVTGAFQNSDGAVVGVSVDNDGTEMAFRAKKAVIFGTGGFTQDKDKSLNYLRGPIWGGCGVPTCTGDFVDIGIALGARLGNMNNAWWLQLPLELAVKGTSISGADVWIPYGDSMVIVNKYGDRVASEKMVYNERSQTHHYWNPQHREFSNLVQFMIYDDAVAQDPTEFAYRFPVPMPGNDAGYVVKGDTWDELARNINERLDSIRYEGGIAARVGDDVKLADDFVDSLSETIERFNGFAESGEDKDFGRGSTPIQAAWGASTERSDTNANPTMAPFASEGPYYCVMLVGGTLDTKGGPVIDTGAHVLHVDGTQIPGLYGAGNCVASPAGHAYWSAGGTIGPAIAFGYLAGKNAVEEPEKPVD